VRGCVRDWAAVTTPSFNGRDKHVAPARHVGDEALSVDAVTQSLSKAGEMHAKVGLLHRHGRPDPIDQVSLLQHRTGVLD
jgi:hypothetical protein